MKDRATELSPAPLPATASATAAVPGLVMMSCDDNLFFEHETVGQIWMSELQLWHSNDNAEWSRLRLSFS